MYSVPPIKNRPVSRCQPTSTDQNTPAASELTAWLEMSSELPHHNPAHPRRTAISHRCRRFAQPHTRMYAGSQTATHNKLTHRKTGKATVLALIRMLRVWGPFPAQPTTRASFSHLRHQYGPWRSVDDFLAWPMNQGAHLGTGQA